MSRAPGVVFSVMLCLAAATEGRANAALCAQAAQVASEQSGVPYAVLMAISQTETGRTTNGITEPWPWTVNLEGAGQWFETRDEALGFAYAALRDGRTSFDTGCFQINYRWHGENFSSLDEMFDPVLNATYAAQFLTDLYAESGSWSVAAGAYHSRTEIHASRYRAQFDEFYAAAQSAAPPNGTLTAARAPRVNTFPLLQAGGATGTGTVQLGSLVPVQQRN